MPVFLPCPRAGAGRNGADHFPSCYSCDSKHVWEYAAKSKHSVKDFHIFQEWNDRLDRPPLFYAKCKSCRANFCSLCLRKLYWGATAKARANDAWLEEVSQIIKGGPQEHIIYFPVGPCCEVKKQHRKVYKEGGLLKQQREYLAKIRQLTRNGAKMVDGCCFLQQYNLFLNSPNDCVDIHYFAKVAHCVPNERTVAIAGMANAYPTNVFLCKDAVVSRISMPRFDYLGRVTDGEVSAMIGTITTIGTIATIGKMVLLPSCLLTHSLFCTTVNSRFRATI